MVNFLHTFAHKTKLLIKRQTFFYFAKYPIIKHMRNQFLFRKCKCKIQNININFGKILIFNNWCEFV